MELVAQDDAFITNKDMNLVVNARGVLVNDRKISCVTELVLVSQPDNGSVVLEQSGAFVYTPNPGYYGPDSFEYKLYAQGGHSSNIATVLIDVRNSPYVYANKDYYSFDPTAPLVVPNIGVLKNDQFPAGRPVSTAIVSQPASGTVAMDLAGGFIYTPPENATDLEDQVFIYRVWIDLDNGYQDEAFAAVWLLPRSISLELAEESRKQTKIITLNSDDDNDDDAPDLDATEATEIDNDWVKINVSVNQQSAFDENIVVEARPRDIRMWYIDNGEYKIIDGPLPSNKIQSIYADAIRYASQEVTISARFEGDWEEVQGSSPEVNLSVIAFDTSIAEKTTIDDVALTGLVGSVFARTKGTVDWETVSQFFGGSGTVVDSDGQNVSPISFQIQDGIGIATGSIPQSRQKLSNPSPDSYKIKYEFAGASFDSYSTTLVPGEPNKFAILGYVDRKVYENVYERVESYTLLNETTLQFPPSSAPDFSKYNDYYLSLYAIVHDRAGNPVEQSPVSASLINSNSNLKETVASNNVEFQDRFLTFANSGEVGFVSEYPIKNIADISQFQFQAGTESRSISLSGGKLNLGFDVSNPNTIYFDNPSKITLKVWVQTETIGSVPNGTAVEWRDSKGFLNKTTYVTNGYSTVEFGLPAYGLFTSAEQAIGRDFIYASVAGYSTKVSNTAGFVDIKFENNPISGLISQTGELIAGNITLDSTVHLESTQVSGTTAEQRVDSALSDGVSAGRLPNEPSQSISVPSQQSVTAKGLVVGQNYRVILDDPTGVLRINDAPPGSPNELRFEADSTEKSVTIRSNGNMPSFGHKQMVSRAVTTFEVEIAHKIYADLANAIYPAPPSVLSSWYYSSDPTFLGTLIHLFWSDDYPQLENPTILGQLVQTLLSMRVSAENGTPGTFEFYTPEPVGTFGNDQFGYKTFFKEAVLQITSKETIARIGQLRSAYKDFLWGAAFGSDDLDMALLGDVALGVVPVVGVWTDIRDVGKNLIRLLPVDLGLGPFDWREMTIASIGIATEFAPPVDFVADAFRTLYKIGKASAPAMQFFLAFEPLFTSAFTTLMSAKSQPGGGGWQLFGGGGAGDDLVDGLVKLGLPRDLAQNLIAIGTLLNHVATDSHLRSVYMDIVMSGPNADEAAKGLQVLLNAHGVDATVTILKGLRPSNDTTGFSRRAVQEALALLGRHTAKIDLGEMVIGKLGLTPEEMAITLQNLGRVLASPLLGGFPNATRSTGPALVEAAFAMVASKGYFDAGALPAFAKQNFMNMADDLATIAKEQDRLIMLAGANQLIDRQNLNWLLKKLGDNTGASQAGENLSAGRLQELAHFALIMKASRDLDPTKISDFSFERWIGAKISSEADADSWTDADILEKLSMWFYETKTTLVAAKGKISGKKGSYAGFESLFDKEWSGLFYKLHVYFNKLKDTGKTPRFELGADLGADTPATVKGEIEDAIENLGKLMKLDDDVIVTYKNAIVVVHVPKRYRKQ